MAGSKLKSKFIKEIKKYLGIPYARNFWKDGVLIKEAVLGGKGTFSEILYATKCAAEKEGLKFDQLSKLQVRNLQKRNKIGIDCSGLAYHLLNFLDQQMGGEGLLLKVTSTKKDQGRFGVRTISAADLTQHQNSFPIKRYEDIQVGDILRHHNGTHVMIVIDKTGNLLNLVHSSKNTQISGVHLAQVEITQPQKCLNYQKWSDVNKNGSLFSSLFNPENYDGIYRLKCWIK